MENRPRPESNRDLNRCERLRLYPLPTGPSVTALASFRFGGGASGQSLTDWDPGAPPFVVF